MQTKQEAEVEKAALDKKIASYKSYWDSPFYPTLPEMQRVLLNQELHVMEQYSEILSRRIAAWVACIIVLLLFTMPLQAQQVGTIRIDYASMLITKQGVGRWTAARNDNPGSITWANGSKSNFPHVSIPATPVRGVLNRAVDPCIASGISDDGCRLTLNLPREPVKLMGGLPTAIQITATGTLTRPDGATFRVVGIFPASATHRVGRKTRQAAAVTFTGQVYPQ